MLLACLEALPMESLVGAIVCGFVVITGDGASTVAVLVLLLAPSLVTNKDPVM